MGDLIKGCALKRRIEHSTGPMCGRIARVVRTFYLLELILGLQ